MKIKLILIILSFLMLPLTGVLSNMAILSLFQVTLYFVPLFLIAFYVMIDEYKITKRFYMFIFFIFITIFSIIYTDMWLFYIFLFTLLNLLYKNIFKIPEKFEIITVVAYSIGLLFCFELIVIFIQVLFTPLTFNFIEHVMEVSFVSGLINGLLLSLFYYVFKK